MIRNFEAPIGGDSLGGIGGGEKIASSEAGIGCFCPGEWVAYEEVVAAEDEIDVDDGLGINGLKVPSTFDFLEDKLLQLLLLLLIRGHKGMRQTNEQYKHLKTIIYNGLKLYTQNLRSLADTASLRGKGVPPPDYTATEVPRYTLPAFPAASAAN